MAPRHGPTWLAAITAAFCGFLAALGLVLAGVRPIEWAGLGGTVVAGLSAAVLGRIRNADFTATLGFTFACMLIEWPILAIGFVLIRYWVTGETVGQ